MLKLKLVISNKKVVRYFYLFLYCAMLDSGIKTWATLTGTKGRRNKISFYSFKILNKIKIITSSLIGYNLFA